MKVIYPVRVKYPRFVGKYVEPLKKAKHGYVTVMNITVVLEGKWLPEFEDARGRFKFYPGEIGTHVDIDIGMFYDGATSAIDFDTRLLFALIHDVACWATEQTSDYAYRDSLDSLAYKIVVAQGGYWFNGFAVKLGVSSYTSWLKLVDIYKKCFKSTPKNTLK